jgi:prepilin-type N-terminal cleavage/methylation domain-containing protein
MKIHHTRLRDNGFTIIELLVATAVFSVILLVITAGIMLFTRDYYKGVIQANTQNVARTIVNTFGQGIQFSPATNISGTWPKIQDSGAIHGYCINGISYGYILGKQLNPGASGYAANQVLVADSGIACYDALSAQMPNDAAELMGKHMRLAQFNVAQVAGSTDAYSIDVRVVYGDDDLLCSPNEVARSCSSQTAMPNLSDYQTPDLQCKGNVGSQFCAVSELSTVVKKRL